MKKQLLLLLFAVTCISTTYGQAGCPSVDAGPDQNLDCITTCANLSALPFVTGNTSSYAVSSIPYSPYAFSGGTGISVGTDDVWSSVVNLGFNFCFFGNSYNQVVLGSNGQLCFNTALAGGTDDWEITNSLPSTANTPGNSIMVFRDIDPSVAGSAGYYITGTYPCRTLVFYFNDVALYGSSCNSAQYSKFQIVLYETTNVIDIIIANSTACTGWNGGYGIIGIQNAAGTTAYCPPGRNMGTWTAAGEAWRFTPNGPANYSVSWFQGATQIATGLTTTVCPTSTTVYTAQAVYTNCDGSTVTVTDNVTINVNSTAPPVTAGSNAPVCIGQNVNLTATSGGTSYSWSGPGGYSSSQQNPVLTTPSPSASGIYTVTLTDNTGCTRTSTVNVTINPLPTSTASSNTPVCDGQSLNLNAGGGSSYSWSGPGGFNSSNQNPVINPVTTAANGTYTVTVTDSNSCINTATVSITVNPSPVASSGNTGPVCQGTSLDFSSGGGSSYSWSGPGGYSSSTQNPQILSADTSNSGVYTVTVTGANGCTNTSTTTVLINPAPTANASNTGPVCAGISVDLSAGTGTGYSWSGPGGYTSSSQNPQLPTPTAGNSGVYTVTVTDANGCTNTATTLLTVNALPNATASNNTPICTGADVLLSANGGTGYSWSGPNAYTSSSQNPTITSASPGSSGIYTVTVTDANGCTNTATTSVSVNNTLTVTAASNSPICDGDQMNLTSNLPGNTYSWSGPGGYNSTQQNPVINPATTLDAGTYTVTVTDAAGCTGSASVTVVVNALPNATAGNNGPVCENDPVTLSSSGGTGYQWSGPSGFSSNQQNPAAGEAGTYTVTVSSSSGCQSTVSTTVVINSLPVVSASSNAPLCAGTDIQFTGTGGTSWAWSGPAGYTSSLQSPVVTNPATGVSGWYYLTATDNNNCQNTDSVQVQVNATPTADFQFSALCFGIVEFNSTSTGNAPLSYQWDVDADGSSDYTVSAFSHTYQDTSVQMVSLLIVDAFGCHDSITLNVPVKGGVQLNQMPDVLSVSSQMGNNILDFELFAPGYNQCIDYTLSIFNRWGIKVFEVVNDSNNPDLNCSSCFTGKTMTGETLTNGTYYYVLEGSDNQKRNGVITIFD